jgi:hypothetical protein
MSEAAERKAFEAKIEAAGLGVTIRYPNRKIAADGARHIALSILGGEGQDIELRPAPTLRRYVKVAQITIFEKEGQGTRAALALADTIRALFMGAGRSFATDSSGRIRCKAPAVIDSGDDGNGWYLILIRVPFTRDETE